jgi:predicted anti-sigma-YlaC factor YlaD
MNTPSTAHLTKEELTDKLLGVPSLTVNAHLLSCPACANELEQMKDSIADFRNAAHSWSEEAVKAVGSRASRVHTSPGGWAARWIMVAAAVIIFVAGSVSYLHQKQTNQAHSVQVSTPAPSAGLSQAQLDQDNQLLSEVSGELSEAVPAPMQPLLVSESSGSGVLTNTVSTKVTNK